VRVEPGPDITAIALFAPTFFLVYVVLYRGSANVVGMLISISVQSERMCRSRLDGDSNATNKLKKQRISILIAINFLLAGNTKHAPLHYPLSMILRYRCSGDQVIDHNRRGSPTLWCNRPN
jgi:hypothetical protein